MDIGKASREYHRETLSTPPPYRRPSSMAGHRVLYVPSTFQIGKVREEADQGTPILPRQIARTRRVREIPGDPRKSSCEQVGQQAAGLNEFEAVSYLIICVTLFWCELTSDVRCPCSSLNNIRHKVKMISPWKRAGKKKASAKKRGSK